MCTKTLRYVSFFFSTLIIEVALKQRARGAAIMVMVVCRTELTQGEAQWKSDMLESGYTKRVQRWFYVKVYQLLV